MANASVTIFGQQRARSMFSSARARRAVAAALEAMIDGALLVERRAKQLAPVDTGRYRTSITHEGPIITPGVGTMRVGSNVKYGPFLEFGTGQRGASTELRESAEATRQAMGYKYGPSVGMVPRSHLFPSLENNRAQIVRDIAEAVRKELEG